MVKRKLQIKRKLSFEYETVRNIARFGERRQMKHLKITTAELAKICGVSQGTVDRALNNRSDISAETKRKIIDIAKLYGYRSRIDAEEREIKGQVGIIVFNLNNGYFSELVMNTEHILRKMGYCTVVMMTHYDKKLEIECIRNMYNMGVCGIILCSVNRGAEFEEYLKMFDIPIAAVGNDIGGVPYVGIDDFAAMYDMTKNVLSDGYSEIVYFSPALKYESAYAQRLRYEGFLRAAEGVCYTVVTDIDDIMAEYPPKTAIICSADYYAIMVHHKAKNVKITGFDNLDIVQKCNLPINSVGYSTENIALAAVDIIFSEKTENVILEHNIIKSVP